MIALRKTPALKKCLAIMLTLALLITMVPLPFGSVAQAAGGGFFVFPNEQYDAKSARVTSDERITLDGSINGVGAKGISYTVQQITMTPDDKEHVVASREEQTANIIINGTNLKVFNLQLFSGLNRITFKGLQGSTEVYDSIYVEYRNGPTLTDLQVSLNGARQELKEIGTTIVKSTTPTNKDSASVSITGKAKNAEKVQVVVNNNSWTFNVSKNNNWEFFASPIVLNKGKNLVKIRAINGTQTVETVREVALYNNTVTFYDVHFKNGSDKVDLSTNPTLNKPTDMIIYGKAIIPIAKGTTNPAINIEYSLTGLPSVMKATYMNEQIIDDYVLVDFEVREGNHLNGQLDKLMQLELVGTNLSTGFKDRSTVMGFTLTAADKPIIHDIRYLSNYRPGMAESDILNLSGTKLDKAEMSSLPTAIEFLVANYGTQEIEITGIKDYADKALDAAQVAKAKLTNKIVGGTVVENINGVPTTLTRVIYTLDALPISGKQKIEFKINGSTTPYFATVTLLYGPFVKFDSVYDGMQIKFDTTTGQLKDIITENKHFKLLEGTLLNVADTSSIEYSDATKRNVYMYLNNTELKLEQVPGKDKTKFRLANDNATPKDNISKAADALFIGENKIKFVYRTKEAIYEKVTTVTIIPLNIPVIPAPDTDGVFPYSVTQGAIIPKPNNDKFEKKGGIYYTRESKMNVYGTFDFYDLGRTEAEIKSAISNLRLLGAGNVKNSDKYKIVITSPNLNKKLSWTLSDKFTAVQNGQILYEDTDGASVDGLTVQYNADLQSFAFKISNMDIPLDGSPVVLNIAVYNNGESGPRATARLEVVPINVPYMVVQPVDQIRVINQNFLEVVIHSPGADKVVINKIEAKRQKYDRFYDGSIVYEDAFRTVVTGLKPNRENKIEFTITRGDDVEKAHFNVKYVPTTIPGAQYMETMKSSHKAFDNNLRLSFPKGTSLIRRDANKSEEFKHQVYSGNQMLFSIANPENGRVNQYDFEADKLPANFDLEMNQAGNVFRGSFPESFIKASPVYWIDPGLADDLMTKAEYDPIAFGNDPYQFPNAPVGMFYNRTMDRELVPSKEGKLTLSYDKNMAQEGGKLVTVFRFDPELKQWENIGGVVDDKKRTITVPFRKFGYYVVAKLGSSYNDVVQHPYARNYVESVLGKGVMNPEQPLSSFGTDMYVSRAEFTRMIVKALDLPLNYEGPRHFDDADWPSDQDLSQVNIAGLWDFRYIETAAREGIVRGISPNVFGVDSNLTRQDASVMIAKAMNLKMETDRSKIRKDLLKFFKDADKIDYYAQPAVLAIAKKGLIEGMPIDPSDPEKGFVFNPEANMLRGDAAVIIARVMIDLKKLPKMS
ncbi:S-layer homology domain-containing protein [Paenibacillus sp. SC116]|uniref:S-layer homology domain-containing protein n=1 Tax=Paenibacillus sp. SC116 TaxID=2968986 RepID=UPI00215A8EF4|nr:S-layer homology domain-containing protein [Paenibacillus sp. SC116]MCR8844783.1 S-layer homology domain-containing protein [Paenibacillus sp. SC116]